MISEERVKLMTRMASYECEEGRKNVPVAKYFRSDFVGLQVLKAVICATIAYMIVFAAYICYNFEELLLNIYKMDIVAFGKTALKYYVIFAGAYAVIVYLVSIVKYNIAKKNLKRYFNNLKLLNSMYAKESRMQKEMPDMEGK